MNLTDITLDYMKRHLESKDAQWLHEVEDIDFTDTIDRVLSEAEKQNCNPIWEETSQGIFETNFTPEKSGKVSVPVITNDIEAYEYVSEIIQDLKESDEWSKFVYDTLDERRDHRESQRSPITYYNAHPKQL